MLLRLAWKEIPRAARRKTLRAAWMEAWKAARQVMLRAASRVMLRVGSRAAGMAAWWVRAVWMGAIQVARVMRAA